MSDGGRHQPIPLILIATVLTFGTGATDLISFVRLGHVFSSVMTGNLVLLGLGVAQTSAGLISHAGTAIGAYIVGAALGSRVTVGVGRRSDVWPASVTTALLAELTLLVAFTVGWELTAATPSAGVELCLLAGAAIAMGIQSAAMRRLGRSLSTTYLTGTLTGVVGSLLNPRERPHLDRIGIAVLTAAAAGAAAAGGLLIINPRVVVALPLATVTAVLAVAATVGVRR